MKLRRGEWLPKDHRIHQRWLKDTLDHVDRNPTKFDPVIEELKDLIEDDTRLSLLVNSMFDQIPNKRPYAKNPAGEYQVRGMFLGLVIYITQNFRKILITPCQIKHTY